VYGEQIVVSRDHPDLGEGADDVADIIPWLAAHNAVWITKDWRTQRNREIARVLFSHHVSAAWLRPGGKHEPRLSEYLAMTATAMLRLPDFFKDASHPRYALINSKGEISEVPPRSVERSQF
jgi:hypothetical protein